MCSRAQWGGYFSFVDVWLIMCYGAYDVLYVMGIWKCSTPRS